MLVDGLLKAGTGKTKKNPGKVLEKLWNFLTKRCMNPATSTNEVKYRALC
jgi:hypothetical protein